MHIVYLSGQGLNACAKYEFDPDKVVCITMKTTHIYMMFGYCGVTYDKIHFGVPVSKKQNMLWGLGGG